SEKPAARREAAQARSADAWRRKRTDERILHRLRTEERLARARARGRVAAQAPLFVEPRRPFARPQPFERADRRGEDHDRRGVSAQRMCAWADRTRRRPSPWSEKESDERADAGPEDVDRARDDRRQRVEDDLDREERDEHEHLASRDRRPVSAPEHETVH